MMYPARKVAAAETATSVILLLIPPSTVLLYFSRLSVISKKMLAAVNPRNWFAPGLRMKFNRVAMNPTKAVDPGLRTHQAVIMSEDTPNMSHRTGSLVMLQNMGDTNQLMTAHSDADRLIAARSRVVKYTQSHENRN